MTGKKIVTWEQKRKRLGLLFISPFIVGAVFFLLIPIFTSIVYSFSSLQVGATGYELHFLGIENYRKLLLVDPTYRQVLLSSLGDAAFNVPIAVIFSFFIASILNAKFHGRTLARGILFIPVLMASGIYIRLASVDQMSNMMASGQAISQSGSISTSFVNLLQQLNLNEDMIKLLVTAVDRIEVIVSMSAIPIIVFLSAFQSISPSIFEASYIEGASKWEVFWKISFPMVSSQILVCVVYMLVDSFSSSANAMIKLVHETSFTNFNFGLGSAMVWIYLCAISLIVGVVYAIINKHIFYYD